MEKLQKAILEQRYHMSRKLLDKGISENIMLKIAHLFKPMTTKEAGEKGQKQAEEFAVRINALLSDTISEEQLIQKATEYQKELLKEI